MFLYWAVIFQITFCPVEDVRCYTVVVWLSVFSCSLVLSSELVIELL